MSINNYYFQHDTTTGVLYPFLQQSAPASSAQVEVLGPYPQDTASHDVVVAYNYPNRYTAQNGQLVPYPYFTLSVAQSTTVTNEWTFTATLNNAPTTPPASCSFTACGQSFTETLTNNAATFTLKTHQSLSNSAVSVSVSASGCSSATATIGSTIPQVGLQVFTPTGDVPTVAPTGTGSRDFLSAYYAMSPASITTLLGDIGTAVSLLTDVVFGLLVPAAQQASYAPLTLTANQQNALTDVKANLLGNLYTTLGNAYPSGGQKQLQYADFVSDIAKSYKAFQQYATDLATIPNLV